MVAPIVTVAFEGVEARPADALGPARAAGRLSQDRRLRPGRCQPPEEPNDRELDD